MLSAGVSCLEHAHWRHSVRAGMENVARAVGKATGEEAFPVFYTFAQATGFLAENEAWDVLLLLRGANNAQGLCASRILYPA